MTLDFGPEYKRVEAKAVGIVGHLTGKAIEIVK